MLEQYAFTSSAPLRLTTLKQVISRLPARMFFLKGIVYSAEEPHRKYELHLVDGHPTIAPISDWGDQAPQTRLLFVARHGSCNFDALEQALKGCEAEMDDL